jgi:hypothetical protein
MSLKVFFVTMIVLTGIFGFSQRMVLSATSAQDPASALRQAREALRLSQAREARLVAEIAALKQAGDVSADVVRDYEAYLRHVRDIRLEHEKQLQSLEIAYAKFTPTNKTADLAVQPNGATLAQPQAPPAGPQDDLGRLEAEFNQSLASFDELLLKEVEAIRQRSARAIQDLAAEAAAAAERLRQKGVDLDAASQGAGEKSEAEAETKQGAGEASEAEAAQSTDGATGQRQTSGVGGIKGDRQADSKHGGGSQAQTRGGREGFDSPDDDDIVARQLREAAEQETDPELKAKLWQEYEAYKRGH